MFDIIIIVLGLSFVVSIVAFVVTYPWGRVGSSPATLAQKFIGESGGDSPHSIYYCIFALPSGATIKLEAGNKQYLELIEGEKGIVVYKGKHFQAFHVTG